MSLASCRFADTGLTRLHFNIVVVSPVASIFPTLEYGRKQRRRISCVASKSHPHLRTLPSYLAY